jgi:phospholipase D1/2
MSDGAAKHPNPTSKTMSKLTSKFDRLSSNVSRLGTAVKTTLNPNHRHDEEWEKEVDAKIEKIRDGHRFRSFAGERDGGYSHSGHDDRELMDRKCGQVACGRAW